jgi:hypothetical protein
MQEIKAHKKQTKDAKAHSRASSRASSRAPSRDNSYADLSGKFHQSASSPDLEALRRRQQRPRESVPAPADEDGIRYVLVTPEMLRKLAPKGQDPGLLTPGEGGEIERVEDADVPRLSREKADGVHFDFGAKPGDGDGGGIIARRMERGPVDDTSSTASESDEEEDFPNPWARSVPFWDWYQAYSLTIVPRIRYHLREPFAEFMGTMILVFFGDGVNNQVTLVSASYDDPQTWHLIVYRPQTANPNVAPSQQGSYLSISVNCPSRSSVVAGFLKHEPF